MKKLLCRALTLTALLVLALCLCLVPAAFADGGIAIDETSFPDPVFRAYVAETCDTDSNGVLSSPECLAVTRIDVSFSENNPGNIASLEGIGHFTALEELGCEYNSLTGLDVSGNPALKRLYCQNNLLEELDVSGNTALEELFCGYNGLTELDVTPLTALKRLGCSGDRLETLDLSRNGALKELYCSSNALTVLDISHNPNLETLYCEDNTLAELDITGNEQLKAIVTDGTLELKYGFVRYTRTLKSGDPEAPAETEYYLCFAQGTKLITGLPASETGLVIDETSFPDPAFRAVVTGFDVDGNNKLSDTEIAAVTQIDVSGESLENRGPITSLKGIEQFTGLTELNCCFNEIADLDLSGNTKLSYVDCSCNRLTKLDVSRNTALNSLMCVGNELTSLDLGQNQNLYYLLCGIMEDDGIVYGNKLTNLDVSGCPNLEILWCTNNKLGSLVLGRNESLNELYCYDNNLTSLDVSGCPALNLLNCGWVDDSDGSDKLYGNKLTSLDVSGCPNLLTLWCTDNEIKSLDLRSNPALLNLYCSYNDLTSLDVSGCPELYALYCMFNRLTALDVSHNPELRYLSCGNNQLTDLVVTGNTRLVTLGCHQNSLTTLDLDACPELMYLMESFTPVYENGVCWYDAQSEDERWLAFDETVRLGRPEPDFVLPAALTHIESGAFEGDAFSYVVIPDGVAQIEARAFAACPNLRYAEFMGVNTEIDDTAFDGVTNLTIIAPVGSKAEAYASAHGYTFLPAA